MQQYQQEIDALFKERGWRYWSPLSIIGRLGEEVGELSREINHRFGDKRKKADEPEGDVEEEIGDIAYTLICFANANGYGLGGWSPSSGDDNACPLALNARIMKAAGIVAGLVELNHANDISMPGSEHDVLLSALFANLSVLDLMARKLGYTLESAVRKSIDKVAVRDKDRFPDGI